MDPLAGGPWNKAAPVRGIDEDILLQAQTWEAATRQIRSSFGRTQSDRRG